MANNVTRDEFDHLKARVDTVEREVEGEKMVTRHILEQTRRNGDDLASIKSRLDRHDQRFDHLERDVGVLKSDVGGLKSDVGGLKSEVNSLRRDLPKIVGDV